MYTQQEVRVYRPCSTPSYYNFCHAISPHQFACKAPSMMRQYAGSLNSPHDQYAGAAVRARYLLPGRSLLRAGYTKETHPHTVGLWLHDVWSRRLLVVCRGEVSWEGGRGRPYYSGVASERGGVAGQSVRVVPRNS